MSTASNKMDVGYDRPPVELLRAIFEHREDGSLVWKSKPTASSPVAVGDVAGTPIGTKKKYIIVHIAGRKILAHTIAWAMHSGEWADVDVDHKDGDGLNNRLSNLRLATRSQNCMNRKARSDNASGLKGARLRKNRDGSSVWVSVITVGGVTRYLGRFGSPEEAHSAYLSAAKENFGEFAKAA